jgi:asparaginyl-tRNA synthetase
MIEPEIAFIDLKQLMLVIETFIKTIVKDITKNCDEEIVFFEKNKPTIKQRLDALIKQEFKKLEYSKAIDILKTAVDKGHKFDDTNIFFGMDLASEHERYICENVYKSPTFLYNYPKKIKAFYMKVNDDNETVAACDLLVPGVGEIVGGSQREDDYDKLLKRSQELNMDITSIQWYLDLRKYGYHSSAGFGLGFERLIMYILDLDNIRDTIPFPRVEGSLKF